MAIETVKSVLFHACAAVLLAACGGGSAGTTDVAGAGTAQTTPPAAPGTLQVTVLDDQGAPLTGAAVYVLGGNVSSNARTDAAGVASLTLAPGNYRLSANHALGYARAENMDVPSRASVSTTLTVSAATVFASASMPAELAPAGISSDRRTADLRFSIFSRAFTRSSYGTADRTPTTPLVRFDDCIVWLDSARTTPTCGPWSTSGISVPSYAFDVASRGPYPSTETPLAVVLLLDQSRRAADYDPESLRASAARQFIRRARDGATPDLLAVAGLAGPDRSGASAPSLPQTPFWLPVATGLTADRAAALAAVKTLVPLTGGAAPLFDSLEAAIRLLASSAPASHRRAVVAILGGGDDGGLTEDQRLRRLEGLRDLQRAAGVEVILVPGPLTEKSAERPLLAELAALMRAPIVFGGLQKVAVDWPNGLTSAADLAADLLLGASLQALDVTFRVPATSPQGFVSGTRFTGEISVESDFCPMGCAEPPLRFNVAIP